MTDETPDHDPMPEAPEAESHREEERPVRRASRPMPAPPRPRLPEKTPVLAAMLSVVPGLGNIYNGLYTRGASFFFIWASLFALAIEAGNGGRESSLGFLIPSMVFFWLFNLFDAFRQATLINLGLTEEDPLPKGQRPGSDLMLGVALLVIGVYGIMVKYFDFDLAWLLDNWPLAVTLFGGWLVLQAWKQRSAAHDAVDAGY